ncbi:YcgL domain-containing protein [Lonepinella sp. BR2474]|uniref:YcgL domain-containing protein n=1 Tax=Lonepinella sp. BR2474 TaxID=3434548 RepID=UPI003F6DD616
MLCAIYKSKKKDGMYLYVEKRDKFDAVPDSLRQLFGPPIFVMLFNLMGRQSLAQADKQDVLTQIQQQGYYLQMPPMPENLLAQHKNQGKQ